MLGWRLSFAIESTLWGEGGMRRCLGYLWNSKLRVFASVS